MLTCLFNPGACVQNAFWGLVADVPWWAWLAVAVVLLGVAWRFAGIPGLVAAAAAIGFVFGRFRPPSQKTQAEFDRQNDNSADFPSQQQIDHKPVVPSGKVDDFWKKYHE